MNLTPEQRELSRNQFATVMTMSRLKQIQTEFQLLKKEIESFPTNAKVDQYRKVVWPHITKCMDLLPNIYDLIMMEFVKTILDELENFTLFSSMSTVRKESVGCLNMAINYINDYIEPMWFIGY